MSRLRVAPIVEGDGEVVCVPILPRRIWGEFLGGEYVEVVPLQKVVFTFGWEQDGHQIPPGSTTIEISLHPEGDKTRVRLVHRGLPDDAISDHGRGWAHYLGRLAITATGGDAGADIPPTND